MVQPALRPLLIPSTLKDQCPSYCVVELKLRTRQVIRHLSALHGAITDKSFQYSHVIRGTPQKSVQTRAHSVISKLNAIISFHCCVYLKCRAAIVQLHPGTLSRFWVLSKQDVKCSTALVNPNTPGSTTLRPSWIWKIGLAGGRNQPHALQ
jgi:hypothetical protein